MPKTLLFGAAALIGIIGTNPAYCLQNGMPTTSQPEPGQPTEPPVPPVPPIGDPSQPSPPITEPLPPPEMPPVAGEARDVPPTPEDTQRNSTTDPTDTPMGPMATPPTPNAQPPANPSRTGAPPSGSDQQAVSGGTTRAMMTPQPATKAYPLCTRVIQDSCRNPGEGPGSGKKRRR